MHFYTKLLDRPNSRMVNMHALCAEGRELEFEFQASQILHSIAKS